MRRKSTEKDSDQNLNLGEKLESDREKNISGLKIF